MYVPTSVAGGQLTAGWGDSSHCLVFAALYLLANNNGQQGALYLSQLCPSRPSYMAQIQLTVLQCYLQALEQATG